MIRLPRPLCACGCGQPVRRPENRWIGAHVPTILRSAGGVNARKTFAYKKRTAKFRALIAQALEGRTMLSHERLLWLCNEVHRRSFQAGWSARRRRDVGGTQHGRAA